MKSRILAAAALGTLIAGSTVAQAGDSSTIRIEPRPYYGAVVTIEQGVRVWRPLPPTRHMIINPTNAPVNLSIADIRETVTHNSYVHGAAGYAGPSHAGGSYAAPLGYARPYGAHRGRGEARPAGLGPHRFVKQRQTKH